MRSKLAVAAALALTAGGCAGGGSTASSGQPGNAFSNLLFWGSTTVPAPPPLPVDDDFECPLIGIADGRASVRVASGEALRVQYSLGDTARECTNIQRDGAFTLKVGAQGSVLLGASGSSGSYTVAVRFAVKSGERVIASRVQRQSVSIPAGETRAGFTMIEEGIQVPPGQTNLEIEVGFDGGAPARQRRAARR